MIWLQNKPIKTKLAIVILAVIITVLALIFSVMMTYEFLSMRQNQAEELTVQAHIIGDNSAAAIAFNDPEVAREVLAALHASSGVERAAIFLPSGAVHAR